MNFHVFLPILLSANAILHIIQGFLFGFNEATIPVVIWGIVLAVWAVSNDAFELWYVLHFQNCNAQQLRTWYNKHLENHLGKPYDKDRETAKKMYDLLLPYQADAIQRAATLIEKYDKNDKACADKNPFTTVYELVMELNKYKKK